MPTDLTVILEHRPGELARLGEVTGEAGVTIHGLAAFTGEGRGVVHVLLDDEAVTGCRAALERAGMGIADEREVFMVAVDDRPAALGELTPRSPGALGPGTGRYYDGFRGPGHPALADCEGPPGAQEGEWR